MFDMEEQPPIDDDANDDETPDSPAEDETESDDSEDQQEAQASVTEEEFILLRLTFDEENFVLEEGVLRQGDMNYTQLTQGKLPFKFTPAIISDEETISATIAHIKQTVEDWVHQDVRIAIVLPTEWGVIKDVTASKDMPADELNRHIAWSAIFSAWEDDEAMRFNYNFVNNNTAMVVGVRQRVFDFAHKLVSELSGKLVELVLKDAPDVNLVKAIEPTPPKPQPETEDIKFTTPKKPKLALILIPIVILICAAGYYLIGIKKIDLGQQISSLLRKEKSITQEEQIPSTDTTQIAQEINAVEDSTALTDTTYTQQPDTSAAQAQALPGPYDGLFTLIHKKANIEYLSITEGVVRCELTASSNTTLDNIVAELNRSQFAASAKITDRGTSAGKHSGIIEARLNDNILKTFLHPDRTHVQNLLKSKGYKLVDDIYTGNLDQISAMLKFIDQNRILFYRISILNLSQNRYKLKLEY